MDKVATLFERRERLIQQLRDAEKELAYRQDRVTDMEEDIREIREHLANIDKALY